MPELPEVETIVCGLIPQIQGETIVAVTVLNDSSVEGSRLALEQYVPGRSIVRIHRRGKLLLMDLDDEAVNGDSSGTRLSNTDSADMSRMDEHFAVQEATVEQEVRQAAKFAAERPANVSHLASRMKYADDYPTQLGIHLKMSGRLFVYNKDTPPEKHTRIIFDLGNGKRLFFDDMRKFGYCRPLSPADRDAWTFLKTLGPEPLEIDAEGFATLFASRKTRIKAALLDQKVIAGIGNIYADESLFKAGIRPDVPCNTIEKDTLKKLHHHLQAVLLQSIKECGSSIKDYRDAHGDAGAFQNNFNVYGRSGCLCTVCSKPLQTAKVAGRTTVFCEYCQS